MILKCHLLVFGATIFLPVRSALLQPDYFSKTDELIRQEGYPCEEHFVTTADGYILRIFRMPNSSKDSAPPVILAHTLFGASDYWLMQGPKNDLAYLLHDAGFDVWLLDFRGNFYSRNHTELDPAKSEFWNFSLHEIGKFDVPAAIDYVLLQTQHKKLVYIGHSVASTVFYIAMSELPDYNEKLSMFIGLAPIGKTDPVNLTVSKKIFLDAWLNILKRLQNQRKLEVHARSSFVQEYFPLLSSAFCTKRAIARNICSDLVQSLFGRPRKSVSVKSLPMIVARLPSGTSISAALQFAQILAKGKFEPLSEEEDEFRKINFLASESHEYNVSRTTCPVAIYSSLNDYVSTVRDVQMTTLKMPNVVHRVLLRDFSHVDFLFSKNAWKELYADIIQLLAASVSHK